jgi:hypothetical protein
MPSENFKAYIVSLIHVEGKTEEALEQLAKEYHVSVPTLKVGLPKRHKTSAFGCYSVPNNQTISVLNSDIIR